jgi:hypothetical protein
MKNKKRLDPLSLAALSHHTAKDNSNLGEFVMEPGKII